MQKILKPFFNDLIKSVNKSKYEKNIISIYVFGSAARGNWIKGKSDLDMIVIVKNKKKKVFSFLRNKIKKLNKKYNLKLEKTSSDEVQYHKLVPEFIMDIKEAFGMEVPLTVFSLDDLNFMKNKIKDPKLWFATSFICPLSILFKNMKTSSIKIYGKPIIEKLKVKISFTDMIKAMILPIVMNTFSILSLPFDRKFALHHAVKASLYELDDSLPILEKKIKTYKEDERIYEKLTKNKNNITHLKKALKLRKEKINLNKNQTFDFVLGTMKFILSNHKELIKTKLK